MEMGVWMWMGLGILCVKQEERGSNSIRLDKSELPRWKLKGWKGFGITITCRGVLSMYPIYLWDRKSDHHQIFLRFKFSLAVCVSNQESSYCTTILYTAPNGSKSS
jgi:hypothetical protein